MPMSLSGSMSPPQQAHLIIIGYPSRLFAIIMLAEESVLNALRSNIPTMAFGIANHHIIVKGAAPLCFSYGANKENISTMNATYAPIRKFLINPNTAARERPVIIQENAIAIKYTSEGANAGTLVIAGPSLALIS